MGTLRKTRSLHSTGFTLIELLVVIAILGILASILFPVFARARENARRSSCQSNLKQIGLAVMEYTQDYDEYLPLASDSVPARGKLGGWMVLAIYPANENAGGFRPAQSSLQPYLNSVQVFVCPSDAQGKASGNSYSSNECLYSGRTADSLLRGKALSAFTQTATIMLFGEEAYVSTPTNPYPADSSTDDAFFTLGNTISSRHLNGLNVGFLDGHVKWSRPEKLVPGFFTGDPTLATCP